MDTREGQESCTLRADLHRIVSNLEEAEGILDNVMGLVPAKDSVVEKEPPDILGLIGNTVSCIEGMSAHIVIRLREIQERL